MVDDTSDSILYVGGVTKDVGKLYVKPRFHTRTGTAYVWVQFSMKLKYDANGKISS